VSPAELAAGVWRIERSRLVGAGARLLRDLDEAEDCAPDALLPALDAWPRDGVPSNPAAWLMTATRNKALDRLRRRAMLQREHEALSADDAASGAHIEPDFVDRLDAARDQAAIGDELWRRWRVRRRSAGSGPTHCRPRSPPATRVPRAPATPTGAPSSLATTDCWRSTPHPWWR
jgi:hypothetical protein